MEVLASTNRMSAITFLSLYFLRKHGTGLQCSHNRSGIRINMGICHYIHFNFCVCYFVCDTIQDTFCLYFMEIMSIVYIHWHFCTTSSIRYIIIRLYRAAHKTGQFQVPVPKAQDNKPKKDRQ